MGPKFGLATEEATGLGSTLLGEASKEAVYSLFNYEVMYCYIIFIIIVI